MQKLWVYSRPKIHFQKCSQDQAWDDCYGYDPWINYAVCLLNQDNRVALLLSTWSAWLWRLLPGHLVYSYNNDNRWLWRPLPRHRFWKDHHDNCGSLGHVPDLLAYSYCLGHFWNDNEWTKGFTPSFADKKGRLNDYIIHAILLVKATIPW